MIHKDDLHIRGQYGRWLKAFTLSLTVLVTLLAGVGWAYQQATHHDKKYEYLSDVLDSVRSTISIVEWELDEIPAGKKFTIPDSGDAGKALTNAWSNLLMATRTGDRKFIQDYFDGAAYKRALSVINKFKPNIDRGMVVLHQLARPRFFHADGSHIELINDEVMTARYEIDENRQEINLLRLTRECSRQIMVLHSIGWKIRNHEVDCAEQIDPYKTPPNRRAIDYPLKGINYYPANTPWHKFWAGFDEAIVGPDLSMMRQLGVNSVRMFIPYDYFLNQATSQDGLNKLDRFLAMAGENNISVIPTLFDFRSSYQPTDWAEEYVYMRRVVDVIRQHKNVQLIDLKNEPDLDYKVVGKARVDAWLTIFTGLLKEWAPELSVTIGWLDHKAATSKADLVDVVSYHEYGDPTDAKKVYEDVKAASAGKRVIVTETGRPSWSFTVKFPFSKESQADWLSTALKNLNASDGVFVWTLYDFDYQDTGMVASIPWRRAMQGKFGLFTNQGEPKPAVQEFRIFKFSPSKNRRSISNAQ